jgi:hypothetical protein
MVRCWGRTRNLTRYLRCGDWRFLCHEHKLQPLICVLSIIAFIGTIASIYSCHAGATKQDVHDMLIQIVKINRDDLMKKYPLGYALFYIDRNEIIAPHNVSELKNIRFSWEYARVSKNGH